MGQLVPLGSASAASESSSEGEGSPPQKPNRVMRLTVTLPNTRVSMLGRVIVDPLKALLGQSLEELLSTILDGPIQERTTPSGAKVLAIPLAIDEDDGAGFWIGMLKGDLGFSNEAGHLVVTVPNSVAAHVSAALAADIASGNAVGPRIYTSPGHADGLNADYGIRVHAGMRRSVQLGTFGELGIEATSV